MATKKPGLTSEKMVMTTTGTRIGVDLRLAAKAAKPGEGGIARQQRECERYATEHGLPVVDIYTDAGGIPSRLAGRTRMIEDLRAGKIDTILCWDTDRIARRTRDFHNLIADLDATGGTFITVSHGPGYGPGVTNHLFGLTVAVLAAVEEQESARLASLRTHRRTVQGAANG